MKIHIFITALFIVSLHSCSKDNGLQIEFGEIKLNKILSYIPIDRYRENQFIVFTNELNEEKYLHIDFYQGLEERVFEDNLYSTEILRVNLTEDSITDYSIYILSTGNYVSSQQYIEYLSGGINVVSESFNPIFGINEKGHPILCGYEETLTLLDKSFYDVFYSFPLEDLNGYSTVYYNSIYGIVGFYDRNNTLWVFSRFEEL